jgi:lysophospholipase L1-like esterase
MATIPVTVTEETVFNLPVADQVLQDGQELVTNGLLYEALENLPSNSTPPDLSDYVKTVNNVPPDENGNVNVQGGSSVLVAPPYVELNTVNRQLQHPLTGTSSGQTSSTWWNADGFIKVSTKIADVYVQLTTAGPGKIRFFTRNLDGTYSVLQDNGVDIAIAFTGTAGVNIINVNRVLPANTFVAVELISPATIGYTTAGRSGRVTGGITGSNLTLATASTANLGIQFTEVEYGYPLNLQPFRETSDLYTTNFANVDEWIGTTGWVKDGNSFLSPSTGGFPLSRVYWNKRLTIDRCYRRYFVKLENVNSRIGVFTYDAQGNKGMFREIDFINRVVKIYTTWNSTATLTASPLSPNVIPFPAALVPTVGRTYFIEDFKLANVQGINITDTENTSATMSWSIDLQHATNPTDAEVGTGWGFPGLAYLEGQVRLTKFSYASPFKPKPLISVLGDSLIEGNTLLVDNATDQRNAAIIYTYVKGEAMISGQGGDNSTGLLSRYELQAFRPKIEYMPIGTNDTNFITLRDNVIALANQSIAKGAIPVFATLHPRINDTSHNAVITAYNDWLRNSSGYLYNDINKLLTVNGDGVTPIASYYRADGIHWTVAGHAVVAKGLFMVVGQYLYV